MNFGVIKLESLSDRAALLARVCLAVVVQYRRVTDAQTDGHTMTAYTTLACRRAVMNALYVSFY